MILIICVFSVVWSAIAVKVFCKYDVEPPYEISKGLWMMLFWPYYLWRSFNV